MKKLSTKRILSLLLAAALLFTQMPEPVKAAEGGTAISSAEAFLAMDPAGTYNLTSNITITESYAQTFTGTFDGNGHTITLGTADAPMAAGAFTSTSGTITNLVIAGTISATAGAVAGVAGSAAGGTISNCLNKAAISITGRTGRAAGIVGNITGAANSTVVTGCGNQGAITASGTAGYAAGIVAYLAGTASIQNSFNTGALNGGSRAGGITCMTGTDNVIAGCYNAGTLTGSTKGQIVAFNNSTSGVSGCTFIGEDPVQGGGTGVSSDCSAAADAAAILTFLSSRGFVADSNGINGGYPVLPWMNETGTTDPDPGTDPVDPEPEKTLTGIEVSGYPESVNVGDTLPALTVTAIYSDDSRQTVSDYQVSGFDSSAATDAQVVTVTYQEKTATFTIKIQEVTSILAPLAGNVTLEEATPYTFKEDAANGWLASNNKGIPNGKATITLTAVKSGLLSFSYKISSEKNYDWLDIKVNGTSVGGQKVTGWSGDVDWTTFSRLVSAGDTIVITYSKDSSSNSGDDTVWLKDFAFAAAYDITINTGVETASITVGEETKTGASASFTVMNGTYAYTVTAFGYEPVSGSITVNGESVTETVTMTRSAAQTITFVLTLPEDMTGTCQYEVKDAEGITRDYAAGLPAGTYTYTASCEGCDSVSGSFTVAAEAVTIPVTLLRSLTLADFITSEYVTAENAETAPFVGVYDDAGNYLKSTVKTNYQNAAITLTFSKAAILAFDYKTDLNTSSYYGLQIKKNDKQVGSNIYGAHDWTNYTIEAAAGDKILLNVYYYGGYGSSMREDYYAAFKNFAITPLYTLHFDVPEGANIEVKKAGEAISGNAADFVVGAGTYNYTISAFGCESVTGSIEMTDKDETVTVSSLVKLPGKKLSFVLPSDASVKVSHETGVMIPDADGGYTLPAGEYYEYEVSRPTYAAISGSVLLDEDKIITLTEDDFTFIGIAWDGTTKTEPKTDEEGNYLISNGAELAWFSDTVNNTDNTKSAKLTSNINLDGKAFTPLGAYIVDSSYDNPFLGTLDGDGFEIFGLEGNSGLVDYLGNSSTHTASVKNLTVHGKISGTGNLGGIVNTSYAIIENCAFYGSVSNSSVSTTATAGIVGRAYADGMIRSCANFGSISNTATRSYNAVINVGGIAGYSYSPLEYCYNAGSVLVVSPYGTAIGGVIGAASDKLLCCYNTGLVSGGSANAALAGTKNNGAEFTNCYYLETSASETVGTSKTSAEMKSEDFVLMLCGTEGYIYHKDTAPINNSYPILAWQGGEVVHDLDAEAVAAAKAELNISTEPITTFDALELPATIGEVTVTWASSNADVISETGVVTLPESGTETVTLTATLTKGDRSDTKEFVIDVLSWTAQMQLIVDELAAKVDGRVMWAQEILHPEETNIVDTAVRSLEDSNEDLRGITISLVSAGEKVYPAVDDTANIEEDGTIHYFEGVEGSNSYHYAQYNNVIFKITLDGAEATFSSRVFVSWSAAYVQSRVNAVSSSITWDFIKGDNTETTAETDEESDPENILDQVSGYVSEDLLLPSNIGACSVTWEPYVDEDYGTQLEIQEEYVGSDRMYRCKIIRPAYEDTEVCLVAQVSFNLLNENEEEQATDFLLTAYHGFQFSLEADENATAADPEETLKALSDKYEALIRDFVNKDQTVDTAAITDDLQMPAPGALEDAGILLKRDYEKVSMESEDEDVLSFYGYHAMVYRPLPGEPDKTVNYTVRINDRINGNLIAEKTFSMTVKALSQEEIDNAAAIMQSIATDEVYWNGIKGENEDKEHITENLKPFEEILPGENGEVTYVRGAVNITFDGIEVDDLPGYDSMSAQPWRQMRSSDEAVITSEQLLLTVPERDQQITIDSVLSYTRYAKYWEKFGLSETATAETKAAYAAFEQFYKQPVSATVTVIGSNTEPDPDDPTLVENIFKDVSKDSWYRDYVQYVYDNGLMTGKSEDTFAPSEKISRGQFAMILWRMEGSPVVEYTKRFKDVSESAWYSGAVMWASSENVGIIKGYENGNFGAADNITREQIALMLYRYAKYSENLYGEPASLDSFADGSRVSGFAKEAMMWAVGNGIITGKENGTKLDPQGKAARAECAAMIMRYLTK